ncbi:MAG: cytochrome c, partial [Candidatus Hydrogenedentales bacterium]
MNKVHYLLRLAPRRRALPLLLTLCLPLVAGCHWDMWNESRLKPLEEGHMFEYGQTARTPVPGTVPYGRLVDDTHLMTGRVDGEDVNELPPGLELTPALLKRGQSRFNIYCTPCHGFNGNGDGMIVRRGFPAPPSYHIDRLRQAPLGHYYRVMTDGFGRMFSYASRVSVEDRWAIAAYIRVLQLSQF